MVEGAETSEGVLFFLRRLDRDDNVKDRLLLAAKTGETKTVGPEDRFFNILDANSDSSEVVLLSHPADYGKRPPKVDRASFDLRVVLLNIATGETTDIVAPMTWGGPVKVRWSADRNLLCVNMEELFLWTRRTGKLERALSKRFIVLESLPISKRRVIFTGTSVIENIPGAKAEHQGLFLANSPDEIVPLDRKALNVKILDYDEATRTVRCQIPFPPAGDASGGFRSVVIPQVAGAGINSVRTLPRSGLRDGAAAVRP